MTFNLFCAFNVSTCRNGPQLTSFVLHSSKRRTALSVNEAGAKLAGYSTQKYIFITNNYLKKSLSNNLDVIILNKIIFYKYQI